MQKIRLRFAPSPSGYLHVGNLRTALLNFLWAHRHGGEFMLRIDDTDSERCSDEYEQGIISNLWDLGLHWQQDDTVRQSQRTEHYDKAAATLREAGRLYDCYETAEELELQRKVNLSQGRPPIYDRSALALSDSEKEAFRAQGRQPYWRFKLSGETIAWRDHIRGEVSFAPGHLSDPVLLRADGRVLYSLSSVVDDGAFAISHIVRGEDHVVNTAVQIEIFQALKLPLPEFAHVPLLLDEDGKSLSKHLGSLAVRDLLAEVSGEALLAYLAHLGLSRAAEGGEKLQDLIAAFDIGAYSRAAPRFSLQELKHLHTKYLRMRDYDTIADKLASLQPEIDATLWKNLRDNVENWQDVEAWHNIIFIGDFSPPTMDEEDKAFLRDTTKLLPDTSLADENFYALWIEAIKANTNRSGKNLFKPLRLALTGKDYGPELKIILPYLSRESLTTRLNLETHTQSYKTLVSSTHKESIMPKPNWKNQTIWIGDNLNIMRGMNSESVDLIYFDPPFNSNANYAAPIGSQAAGAEFKDTWGLNDVNLAWHGMIKDEHPGLYDLLNAVKIIHGNSMMSYLIYMAIRTMEMHRIIKQTGSIYLHCDPTTSHYWKLLLDALFGKNHCQNEIIWRYRRWSAAASRFQKMHDIIFWYTKSKTYTFTKPLQNYANEAFIETTVRGIKDGKLVRLKDKKGNYIQRKKENKGVLMHDVWDDINFIPPTSKERTGYPTQKPRTLLERIIKASTNEGDVVLDPFCGCATACIAAENLNRQWIGIDISPMAAKLVQDRMHNELGLFNKTIIRKDIPNRTDLGKIPKYNSPENKKYLYGEQGGICFGCKQHFMIQNFTIDHIIPKAKGGTDHRSNLQLLCGNCNSIKNDESQEELIKRLTDKGYLKR